MSAIGIDFGNDSCYVAAQKDGGIETLFNDYDLRATPSYVAFDNKKRFIGVGAKDQQMANMDNTVGGFKSLLGCRFNDQHVQHELGFTSKLAEEAPNGRICFKAHYLERCEQFFPEQLTAMLFTKLKETSNNALQTQINNCVLTCPAYFSEEKRQALRDAAKIADLNVLDLMNETTATALYYGFYKEFKEFTLRNVIFVDCGHTSLQVSACAFTKDKLEILATTCINIGGRNIDAVLANHFAEKFKNDYKLDVKTNPRAWLRLITGVEKLKKQMSVNNSILPLSIESLMNDVDVKSSMQQFEMEKLCHHIFQCIERTFQKLLQMSKLSMKDIHSVEIVGGSTRIPAIKELIEKVFGKAPSITLNQDESVSCGAALQCAIMSPAVKVRKFKIIDNYHINTYNDTFDETNASTTSTSEEPWYKKFSKKQKIIKTKEPVKEARMIRFKSKELQHLIQKETEMIATDANEKSRVDARNVLEEFVYDMLKKLKSESFVIYVADAEKENLSSKLNHLKNWLYDEGDGCDQDTYNKKFMRLQQEADKIKNRMIGFDECVSAFEDFNISIANARKAISEFKNVSVKFDHLNETEFINISEAADKAEKWLDESKNKFAQAVRSADCPIKSKDIRHEIEILDACVNSVINRPKPKPMPAPKEYTRNDEVPKFPQEFFCDIRKKIQEGSPLAPYVGPVDREIIYSKCIDFDKWLSGDGKNVNNYQYNVKFNELRGLTDAIEDRANEFQMCSSAFDKLYNIIGNQRKELEKLEKGSDVFNYWKKVVDKAEKWFNESLNKFANAERMNDSPIKLMDIYRKIHTVQTQYLDEKTILKHFIYRMNNMFKGGYLERYVEENERRKICIQLNKIENWLYTEGENCGSNTYNKKFIEVHRLTNHIENRANNFEMCSSAFEELKNCIYKARKTAEYQNRSPVVDNISKAANEAQNWLDASFLKFTSAVRSTDCPIKLQDIRNKIQILDECVNSNSELYSKDYTMSTPVNSIPLQIENEEENKSVQARQTLENFICDKRKERYFQTATRDSIWYNLNECEKWLRHEGKNCDLNTYNNKLIELKRLINDILANNVRFDNTVYKSEEHIGNNENAHGHFRNKPSQIQ